MELRQFYIASDEEIKKGETTDVYFSRTETILKAKNLKKNVVAEVTVRSLPKGWPWAILNGIEEIKNLLKGYPIDVDAAPEGTVFRSSDHYGYRIPLINIEGSYSSFCKLETPLLGLICQSSGISTAAARIKKAAGRKTVINFGARRMHPSLSPLIGRAAYLGGLDGVSSLSAAKLLNIEPTGTMPHSLIIVFGDQLKAWKAFDDIVSKEIQRIILVDTYYDEKSETLMAINAFKKNLWGIRLDTPWSRRGDMKEIIKEIRWELNIRGYDSVKIFVSGGLDDYRVKELGEAGADGFGVGTWISNAPVIDFSLDIVEIDRRPVAKRGKLGGKKQVWRCSDCFTDIVLHSKSIEPVCPKCGKKSKPLLKPLLRNGDIVTTTLKDSSKIREYVLKQLERLSLD